MLQAIKDDQAGFPGYIIMKSVFDKTTRSELINRINTLNENSTAQWGKMNVCQITKHCALQQFNS